MCERKMLCKVQNSIAASSTILLSIFGMKSTFRLKEDFFYLVFFSLEEKNAGDDTYAKKELVVWWSADVVGLFLKRERVITQAKIGTFLAIKKNQKIKTSRLFRPWAIKRCRGLSSFTYNDTLLQFHCSAKYNVLPNWVNPHQKKDPRQNPLLKSPIFTLNILFIL